LSDDRSGNGSEPNGGQHKPRWLVRLIAKVNEKLARKKQKESAQDKLNRRLANATVAIAFFSFASLIVGILQWDALTRTDDTTREALIGVQRPFISITSINARVLPAQDVAQRPSMTFSPYWFNSGNTPTKNLTIAIDCRLYNRSRLDDIGIEPELSEGQNPSSLGPKIGNEIGNCFIHGDDFTKISGGTVFFYILGRADYNDSFARVPPHITEFCAEMHVDLGLPGTPNTGLRFTEALCNRAFNCTDEECDQQRKDREAKRPDIVPKKRAGLSEPP
jgi:hypothetical protein